MPDSHNPVETIGINKILQRNVTTNIINQNGNQRVLYPKICTQLFFNKHIKTTSLPAKNLLWLQALMENETITIEETKHILGMICGIYKTFTANDYQTWHRVLNRIGATYNQTLEAVDHHIANNKYAPVPADLITYIKDNRR